MICADCGAKQAQDGYDECFRCRVASVGFTFAGGGGYGRATFSERTNTEFLNENVGFDHREKLRSDTIAPLKEYHA